MVTHSWLMNFPQAIVNHLEAISVNHRALLLHLNPLTPRLKGVFSLKFDGYTHLIVRI